MLFGTSNSNKPEGGKESWSEWLDRAERESWQMELLLSGFAIVLLAQVKMPLDKWLALIRLNAGINDSSKAVAAFAELLLPNAWLILISTLVLGVVLRALWISSIGLRSVSGGLELDELNLADKFRQFLDKRLPEYDDYVATLENICSLLFGLSFLMVFSLVGFSVLFVMVFFGSIASEYFVDTVFGEDNLKLKALINIIFIMVFILPITLVYAIDFISGSAIKQSNSFAKIYYPIYRVLGWLTLARLYRPLYYNFIDNKLGRNAILAILPFSIVMIVVMQFQNGLSTPYLPTESNIAYGASFKYFDSYKGYSAASPRIESKYVKGNTIALHLPLGGSYYSSIEKGCEDQAKSYDNITRINKSDSTAINRYKRFIDCLQRAYVCTIDGEPVTLTKPIIASHPDIEGPYLIFYISVEDLERGGHLLVVYPNWEGKSSNRLNKAIPFIKQ